MDNILNWVSVKVSDCIFNYQDNAEKIPGGQKKIMHFKEL